MNDPPARGRCPHARIGLVSYTHWMYALHALAAFIGIVSSAAIALHFVFGLPSIIAIVMNYLKRDEARGTWLESHFAWQRRTFWWALLWVAIVFVLSLPLFLILLGFFTFGHRRAADRAVGHLPRRTRLAASARRAADLGLNPSAGSRRMQVAQDKVVLFHYTLTNDAGEVLDSSDGGDPLAYLHGQGNIVAGLEKALDGGRRARS